MQKAGLAGVMLLALAACAGGDRALHSLDSGDNGPDEFAVLPALPLEIPPVLDLPPPTPGGANRTDRDPVAEGLAALGGNAAAGGAGDVALMAAVSRAGVDPAIRQTLASEDAALRARAGGLFGLGGGVRYWRLYAAQALDAAAELARFRASGVAVPSAPPQG